MEMMVAGFGIAICVALGAVLVATGFVLYAGYQISKLEEELERAGYEED